VAPCINREMKRSFSEFDQSIPSVVWEQFPDHKKQLDRMNDLETSIFRKWTSHRRQSLESNCEPAVLTKILRVFLRSHFVPAKNGVERAHFIISVEGRILDTKYFGLHFGSFFDSIKLVINKRVGEFSVVEWMAAAEPNGRLADCFRFKIYHDKPCQVKCYLLRNDLIQPRYDLSPGLRDLLPCLRWDPTDEDILLAVWCYVTDKNLFDPKTKTMIKCDEKLKEALDGVDSIPICNLRQKVLDLCNPARAIVADFMLSSSISPDPLIHAEKVTRFGPTAIAKAGGRVFDIDVDIIDDTCHEILAELNESAQAEKNCDNVLTQIQSKIAFISREISRKVYTESTNNLVIDPYDFAEIPLDFADVAQKISIRGKSEIVSNIVSPASSAQDENRTTGSTSVEAPLAVGKATVGTDSVNISADTGINISSAIHVIRGFIDVGDASSFQNSCDSAASSWIRDAACALISSDNK
jgi:hypothetical protein